MTEIKRLGDLSIINKDDLVSTVVVKEPKPNMSENARFIVIDGPDGIGKGEMETSLRRCEEIDGKAVFDSIAWCKAYAELPELKNFWGIPRPQYHTVMTAEPTYAGVGDNIRREIVMKNGRDYSPSVQIQAYSVDRLIQMQRIVVPALEKGLNVIQSRCLASTLTYQILTAMDKGQDIEKVKQDILSHDGNKYQLVHRPDLLIIATIDSVEKVIERLKARGANEKDDKSIFDNIEFQGRLKPLYESQWLREIFYGVGTHVAYLNAGLSIGSSRKQASEIYRIFQKEGKVPDKYKTPEAVLREFTDQRV